MSKRILVLIGHPRADSLCRRLAASYAEGASSSGAEVRAIHLRDLRFDPVLHEGYATRQPLEPDLETTRDAIDWCEHLVLVYPTWWGMPPAIVKGLLDRLLLPGWAFKYRPNSVRWDRLLAGRSARLIVTMDAPPSYDALVYGGRRVMKHAVLRFCGFKPVRVTAFGSVKQSSEKRRAGWIARARSLGTSLA